VLRGGLEVLEDLADEAVVLPAGVAELGEEILDLLEVALLGQLDDHVAVEVALALADDEVGEEDGPERELELGVVADELVGHADDGHLAREALGHAVDPLELDLEHLAPELLRPRVQLLHDAVGLQGAGGGVAPEKGGLLPVDQVDIAGLRLKDAHLGDIDQLALLIAEDRQLMLLLPSVPQLGEVLPQFGVLLLSLGGHSHVLLAAQLVGVDVVALAIALHAQLFQHLVAYIPVVDILVVDLVQPLLL